MSANSIRIFLRPTICVSDLVELHAAPLDPCHALRCCTLPLDSPRVRAARLPAAGRRAARRLRHRTARPAGDTAPVQRGRQGDHGAAVAPQHRPPALHGYPEQPLGSQHRRAIRAREAAQHQPFLRRIGGGAQSQLHCGAAAGRRVLRGPPHLQLRADRRCGVHAQAVYAAHARWRALSGQHDLADRHRLPALPREPQLGAQRRACQRSYAEGRLTVCRLPARRTRPRGAAGARADQVVRPRNASSLRAARFPRPRRVRPPSSRQRRTATSCAPTRAAKPGRSASASGSRSSRRPCSARQSGDAGIRARLPPQTRSAEIRHHRQTGCRPSPARRRPRASR